MAKALTKSQKRHLKQLSTVAYIVRIHQNTIAVKPGQTRDFPSGITRQSDGMKWVPIAMVTAGDVFTTSTWEESRSHTGFNKGVFDKLAAMGLVTITEEYTANCSDPEDNPESMGDWDKKRNRGRAIGDSFHSVFTYEVAQ